MADDERSSVLQNSIAPPIDRNMLFPDGKPRAISSSTPFVKSRGSDGFNKLCPRSLSISVCSSNDSGYSDTLSDSSSSFYGPCLSSTTETGCPTITVLPTTPTRSPRSRDIYQPCKTLQFSPSPFLTNSEAFLTRRSLDSDPSFLSDLDLTQSESMDTDMHVPEKSKEDVKCNLNFEMDIDGNSMCVNDSTKGCYDNTRPMFLPELSDSQLASRFQDVLRKFSPAEPDRLIGRKIGLDQVDILGELSSRNVICVTTILSYLEPIDLCRMCLVSRGWKSICQRDRRASERRAKYLKLCQHRLRGKDCLLQDFITELFGDERDVQALPWETIATHLDRANKENLGKKRVLVARGLTTDGERRNLADLQCVGDNRTDPPSPPPSPSKTNKDLFQEAAQSLKNEEKLQKCPKCLKPAKLLPIQERGLCLNTNCKYDYCSKCFFEFHQARPCAPIAKRTRTDNISINSKRSKKNLKRL